MNENHLKIKKNYENVIFFLWVQYEKCDFNNTKGT